MMLHSYPLRPAQPGDPVTDDQSSVASAAVPSIIGRLPHGGSS
jgi:hypothetical protein